MGTEIEMDIIIRQELNFENYFSVISSSDDKKSFPW
jgi:hypothetical protein